MSRDFDPVAAERFEEDLCGSLSAVGHRHNVEICLRKNGMEAITNGGGHLFRRKRFLEFIRRDQNAHELK